jgi:hypothetical protein
MSQQNSHAVTFILVLILCVSTIFLFLANNQYSCAQQQKANINANKASLWAQSASGRLRLRTSTSASMLQRPTKHSTLRNKPGHPKPMVQQTLKARDIEAHIVNEDDSHHHDNENHESGHQNHENHESESYVDDSRNCKNSSAEVKGYYPLEPLDNEELRKSRVEKVLREIEEERMRYLYMRYVLLWYDTC